MEVITLKRISQVLGLSISTVSRALKNHPDISQNTKTRVHELANSLDYEPNINAISLRSKKNNLIGLIVPTISGFFYDSFISAVETECRKNGYTLMILQSGNDAEQETESLKICRQNRVTGLFVCLSTKTKSMDAFMKVKDADIPLVFFDKVPTEPNYNKVSIDDVTASKFAANLIIKKKHKEILAIFGNENLSITKTRLNTFNEICSKTKDVVVDNKYCSSSDEARELVRKIFTKKKKPTAIFCMSDEILIGVVKSIQELKINIPNEVAIVAMSDGMLPTMITPEITYVETSGYKLGLLAFEQMIKCINGAEGNANLFTTSTIVTGKSI
jgi:LacI family transcriptional regulator